MTMGARLNHHGHSGSGGSAASTSRTLIERLKNNELPAWRELVQLYSPLIFYWCRRSGLPEQECSDITQEVFRSVFNSIGNFRKQRDNDTFRGWLRTVTTNKVRDHYRRNPHRGAVGGSEAWNRLAQVPDDDDLLVRDQRELQQEHALFMRAIGMIREEFTDRTWSAFWNVVVEGWSAGETAARLGMKSGAVRVAKSRVLKRLREQLGDQWRS